MERSVLGPNILSEKVAFTGLINKIISTKPYAFQKKQEHTQINTIWGEALWMSSSSGQEVVKLTGEKRHGVPLLAQWVKDLTSIHEDVGLIPRLAQWVKVRCYWKLWHRSLQMRLGYCIAVAVVKAGSCSSNSILSLGASICHRCGHTERKKKNYSSPSLPGELEKVWIIQISQTISRFYI